MTRDKQDKTIKELLKSKEEIVINKKLLKVLDFEDYRDFITTFGKWAYNTDFTYKEYQYTKSFDKLLRTWLKYILED